MAVKKWNWQLKDWPNFSYDKDRLEALEAEYMKTAGVSLGVMKSLPEKERSKLSVELICDEALKTSEIEGEILNRDSVRSSIIHEFGLGNEYKQTGIKPEEQGIAMMMRVLYSEFKTPLTHEMLYNWHEKLMFGRYKVKAGGYRTHMDEMRVVSGCFDKPKIHFVAPPSKDVPKEMDTFIDWFNNTHPRGENALPPLTRAGITHLYFLSIHPFEDGNGRISRALVLKALSQDIQAPVLTAISSSINAARRKYYELLGIQSRGNEITDYLEAFGKTIFESQELTVKKLEFIIQKTRFFDAFRGKMNPRQEKVVLRIFKEGLKGFDGGFSVKNYIAVTKASRATATRDLKDLVDKGAFNKTGQLKSTRYELNLSPFQNFIE